MPPVVAVAGIAAAATVGGAVLSSNAQKKAANQASDTAASVAAQNNALAREQSIKNEGYLGGYVSRGNDAGNAINSLLGLGGQNSGGPASVLPQAQQGYQRPLLDFGDNAQYGGGLGGYPSFNPNQPQGTVQSTPATTESAQQDYNKAFENYQNSTGYQFRVNEGNNSINTGYAAAGALRSGAAQKSLANYGQNIASGEFGNYLGYLSNQQGVGLSGASALAGVGQNYVNNVTANNNSAGTVAANAALAKGQANANLYGGIADGIGNFLGSSFG